MFIEKEIPCECGCKFAKATKTEIETANNGFITMLHFHCIRCKKKTIKQKIRIYNPKEEFHYVQMDKDQLEKERNTPDTRLSITHNNRSSNS